MTRPFSPARPLLLVEDDENDAFFFHRAMGKAGLSVPLRVARCGREATEYLAGGGAYADRVQFPPPSLVILDLNLSAQTGLELLRWIRPKAPEPLVPVIVLTSSTSEDLRDAYRAGASAYVSKPAELGLLVSLLRAVKDFWFGHNRSVAG